MKTYNHLFSEIISWENLIKAAYKASKGKRTNNNVIGFNIALIENLCTLREELETAVYRPGGYREFYIYDAKKRKISCPETLSLIDLLIDHSNIQDSAVHYFTGGGL